MPISHQYPSPADIEKAAIIAPPMRSDPSLVVFHFAISDFLVAQKAKRVSASTSERDEEIRDYEGYTEFLYSLVRRESRELRTAMQRQIDRYNMEVQMLDVWRYSEHLPMIVLKGAREVEMMTDMINREFPGLRFICKNRGARTSSAPLPPVATDSNASRGSRSRSRRHD
ncbi:hypothetical protein EVG20_g7269 [Dentipellis fragilis]|uniref:Uncharacterized protein n=1 Tax=Dentipellis fragilis TaxID=205917 RepID=A0A4Y9YG60_9AGAM|nr:hypothetical protein EVG20_g7269 [Dentipellis fragilis]